MTAREQALRHDDKPLLPREKLLAHGAARLSDRELVSLLLGTGTKGKPVERLAEEVLSVLDTTSGTPDVQDLRLISGLGAAKASLVTGALELARRILCPGTHRIRFPADVLPLVRHYADRKQKHFLSLSLNGAHEVEATRVVSVGLVNRALVSPCGSRAFLVTGEVRQLTSYSLFRVAAQLTAGSRQLPIAAGAPKQSGAGLLMLRPSLQPSWRRQSRTARLAN